MGCLADSNMFLSEDCRELSFYVLQIVQNKTKSAKMSDSCTGNVLNHFLFWMTLS